MNETITALGGLSGLAAFLTAIATFVKVKSVKSDTTELKPDHGNSINDQIQLIKQMISGLGHQIGQIRKDAAITHEDLAERVRRLEERQK